jgi:hypothetical protein
MKRVVGDIYPTSNKRFRFKDVSKPIPPPTVPVVPDPETDPFLPPDQIPSPGDGSGSTPIDPTNPGEDPGKDPPADTGPLPPEPDYPPDTPPSKIIDDIMQNHPQWDDDTIVRYVGTYATRMAQVYKEHIEKFPISITGESLTEQVIEDVTQHKYAVMAEASYMYEKEGAKGVEAFLAHPDNAYIEKIGAFEVDPFLSDAEHLVMHNIGTGETVVSFRGTVNAGDWATDAHFLWGGEASTARFQRAEDLMQRVMHTYDPGRMSVAGHSLGGGISTYIAEKMNLPGYHYNPAAFHNQYQANREASKPLSKYQSVEQSEGVVGEEIGGAFSRNGYQKVLNPPSAKLNGYKKLPNVDVDNSFIPNTEPQPQSIFRTHADVVSQATLGEARPNYVVKNVNTLPNKGVDVLDVHGMKTFHPKPTEVMANKSLMVERNTIGASIRGGMVGVLRAGGIGLQVGMAGKELYDDITKSKNKSQMASAISKTAVTQVGTLAAGEAGFSLATSAAALSGLTAAAAGSAAATMGLSVVALGVSVAATFAAQAAFNAMDKAHLFEARGWENVGKKIDKSAKKTGKKISKAFKKIKKIF